MQGGRVQGALAREKGRQRGGMERGGPRRREDNATHCRCSAAAARPLRHLRKVHPVVPRREESRDSALSLLRTDTSLFVVVVVWRDEAGLKSAVYSFCRRLQLPFTLRLIDRERTFDDPRRRPRNKNAAAVRVARIRTSRRRRHRTH